MVTPTQSTLERLNAIGAKVYRTDVGGTIVITSNGQNIKVNRNATTYNSQAPPPKTAVIAKVVKTPAPSAVAKTNDVIVFKTKTGAKYHLDGCSSLSKSKISIKLSEAKAEGLTPCSKCHPPE